jgi:antitoxin StbD
MSTVLVTVTEAKGRLGELIREATEEDVVVVRHGHPAAVLVGAERYDALLEELEDLKDRLSIYESSRSEPTLRVGFDKMAAELGLR